MKKKNRNTVVTIVVLLLACVWAGLYIEYNRQGPAVGSLTHILAMMLWGACPVILLAIVPRIPNLVRSIVVVVLLLSSVVVLVHYTKNLTAAVWPASMMLASLFFLGHRLSQSLRLKTVGTISVSLLLSVSLVQAQVAPPTVTPPPPNNFGLVEGMLTVVVFAAATTVIYVGCRGTAAINRMGNCLTNRLNDLEEGKTVVTNVIAIHTEAGVTNIIIIPPGCTNRFKDDIYITNVVPITRASFRVTASSTSYTSGSTRYSVVTTSTGNTPTTIATRVANTDDCALEYGARGIGLDPNARSSWSLAGNPCTADEAGISMEAGVVVVRDLTKPGAAMALTTFELADKVEGPWVSVAEVLAPVGAILKFTYPQSDEDGLHLIRTLTRQ